MDDIQVGDQYFLVDRYNKPRRTFTIKELRHVSRHVVLEDSLLRGDGEPYIHTVHFETLRGMFRADNVNVLPYSHRS